MYIQLTNARCKAPRCFFSLFLLHATVSLAVCLTSRLLEPTYKVKSPVGTTQFCLLESQTLRSRRRRLNETLALAPTSRSVFWKPRSCLGGVLADAGNPTYSWATSAPFTLPELATVTVTVATVSQRSARPPGTTVPVAAPDFGLPCTATPE